MGAQFDSRGIEASLLGDGKCSGIVACNIYSYSVLSFVAQIRNPPKALRDNANHLNRVLLKGPYRWMPDELIPVMQTHLVLPAAPYNLEIYCKAVQLRLICSNSIGK